MSYHILYRKQFVKVGDTKVIPMVEGGDNNVWESDNRRRARDWYSTSFNGSLIVDNLDLLKNIDEYRNSLTERYADREDKYEDKRFGWFVGLAMGGNHTSKTTFGSYRNFYATGIEQAKTIEELRENGVSLTLEPSYFERDTIEKEGLEYKSITPATTDELIAAYAELKDYYKDTKYTIYAHYAGIDYYMRRVERERSLNNRRNRSTTPVEVTEWWGLYSPNYGWFIKATARSYKYSYSANYQAKGFFTEKEAIAYHKRCPAQHIFQVKKVEAPRTFYVTAKKKTEHEKDTVIQ